MCERQACHGCAYRIGAAANEEPDNRLRGIFAALGGYLFACHESLGWRPDTGGYEPDMKESLAILMARPTLLRLGASEIKVKNETAALCEQLRVCEGWKASVARLKAAGWFDNPAYRMVRRQLAKQASALIDRLESKDPYAEVMGGELHFREIEEALTWFVNEAREADCRYFLAPGAVKERT